MRPSLLALLATLALIVACAAPAASPRATSGGAAASGSAASAPGALRIEVGLSDSLKMEPASLTVPVGVPVTFVVTNRGATEHEFYLGDEAAQAAHEAEMVTMGGMAHDEPNGIGLKPGATKELTYTFPTAGTFIAGCHVLGHYGAGMKAMITVGG